MAAEGNRVSGEERGVASIPNFQAWITVTRVLLDALAITIGSLVGRLFFGGPGHFLDFPEGALETTAISVAIGCLSCGLFGLYGLQRSFLDIVEQRQVLRMGIVASSGTRLILFLMHIPVSAGLFASIWIGSVISIHFARLGFHWLGAILRERGWGEVTAVVYGAGDTGVRLARHLTRSPEMGVVPVGFLDDRLDLQGRTLNGLPVLGDFYALEGILRDGRARRVFIALPRVPRRTILDILDVCRRNGATFHIVPSMPEPLLPMVELHELEGIPLLGPPPSGGGRLEWLRKRCLDLLASPILGAVAVTVGMSVVLRRGGRKESLTVRSVRVGHRGRLILLPRFRTEWTGEPQNRFDRFLVATGLNRSASAWSLFRGDLTLVGPRPMAPREVARMDDRHLFRLDLVPGITGLWRIAEVEEGRFDEVESDLQYLRLQSLLLDLSVILRTLDFPWRRLRRN